MKGTVLVTGGTGYIGSHTVVELINDGFKVVIVDNLSNSNSWIADRIAQITGKNTDLHVFDVSDSTRLKELVQQKKDVCAIIHFAAHKAVGESVEKPLMYYKNNLGTLISVLEVMGDYAVHNLVFSSSCTVYGQPQILPVTENTPLQKAQSPYGNTKQIGEDIVTDTINATASLHAILLRYFNPIGAHPSALLGELPNGVPNNLVPFITQTAAGKRPELKVFGNDYNTPDGSCIRDYINVVDLAKAHVVAVNRLVEKKSNEKIEVFNLGTGKGVSVLEAIHAFEKATGVKIPYQIVGRRAGDIEKVWADTQKANTVLGWKAEKNLEETMLSAWNWEKTL